MLSECECLASLEVSSLFGNLRIVYRNPMVSLVNSLKVLDVQNGWEARAREGPPYFAGHFKAFSRTLS
jgi:hypothetical protein